MADYHIYPIADNDTPMLSADRLEYTLSNGLGQVKKLWEMMTGVCIAPSSHYSPQVSRLAINYLMNCAHMLKDTITRLFAVVFLCKAKKSKPTYLFLTRRMESHELLI